MKKALIILIPFGTVVGLAIGGLLPIPGLPRPAPVARAIANPPAPRLPASPQAAVRPPASPPLPKSAPLTEPDLGAETLAGIWNEVKTPQLIKISASWKEDELASVLIKMDTGQVAKLLETLAKGDDKYNLKADPTRASKLSRLLQKHGAIVAEDDATKS